MFFFLFFFFFNLCQESVGEDGWVGRFPYSLGTLITDLTMDRAFASLIGVSQVPGRLENLPVPQLFAPGREKGAEDWQQLQDCCQFMLHPVPVFPWLDGSFVLFCFAQGTLYMCCHPSSL